MRASSLLHLLVAAIAAGGIRVCSSPAFPVQISVDAARPIGEYKAIYRFFGADEPNYAYMKDGRKLLAELGELNPNVYFRTHNLLTSGDGTPALKWGSTNVYTEDEKGNPVYDWTVVDRIFDAYLKAGVRPYVQVGFMPEALSTHPEPYQHEWRPGLKYDLIGTGWSYPPKDWGKWRELVYRWAKHCAEKYGMAECERWYWEIWNEPNGPAYWKGTHEEFCRLHDLAVDAVRQAIPKARVGGADTAGPGGKFTEDFLEHCLHGKNFATGQAGTPLDFLSFHAKGNPRFVDGHVRMGIAEQFRAMESAYKIYARHPELKGKPIIIGESDPDGCAACQGKQLGYRNTTLYASYTAATFCREQVLAEKYGANLEGALTWAFEFEDQPYFAGQRVMANNGIDLPVLNVFRMLAKMSGQRISATSSAQVSLDDIVARGARGTADVGTLATRNADGSLGVIVWHYHDDDLPGDDADVTLALSGIGGSKATVTRYAVDEEHSNAFAAWKRMGMSNPPSDAQYADLVKAGHLEAAEPTREIPVAEGHADLTFKLVRQGVTLVVLVPAR